MDFKKSINGAKLMKIAELLGTSINSIPATSPQLSRIFMLMSKLDSIKGRDVASESLLSPDHVEEG